MFKNEPKVYIPQTPKGIKAKIKRLEVKRGIIETERKPYEGGIMQGGISEKHTKPLKAINTRIKTINQQIAILMAELD